MDGVVLVNADKFVDIGAKAEYPVPAGTGRKQFDRHEGRVIDLDAPLFLRRDQPVSASLVHREHGREQAHEFFASDGRAMIIPNTVPVDTDIHVAAEKPPVRRCESNGIVRWRTAGI